MNVFNLGYYYARTVYTLHFYISKLTFVSFLGGIWFLDTLFSLWSAK